MDIKNKKEWKKDFTWFWTLRKKIISQHLIIQLWIFTTRSASCPNLDSSNFPCYFDRAAVELTAKSCKCSSFVSLSPGTPQHFLFYQYLQGNLLAFWVCVNLYNCTCTCLCSCLQDFHRVSLSGQMSHLNTLVLSHKPQQEDTTSILETVAK